MGKSLLNEYANASRIVACVNACRHLTTEQLEAGDLDCAGCSTLADIRTALGVGDKPMLGELAGIVETMKRERNEAVEALSRWQALVKENEPRHLLHASGVLADIAVKCRRAGHARAPSDHIGEPTEMVGDRERQLEEILNEIGKAALAIGKQTDRIMRNFSAALAIKPASAALAGSNAEDAKPAYRAMEPEPWGGPEGEE